MSDRFFFKESMFSFTCVSVCGCVHVCAVSSPTVTVFALICSDDKLDGHANSGFVLCYLCLPSWDVSLCLHLTWSFGSTATPWSLTVFLSCSFLSFFLPPSCYFISCCMITPRPFLAMRHGPWLASSPALAQWGWTRPSGWQGNSSAPWPPWGNRPSAPTPPCTWYVPTVPSDWGSVMWRLSAAQKITAKNKALTGFCPTAAAPVIISEGQQWSPSLRLG